ncbi:hypothetical protein J2X43_005398 [Rhizobium sp. BE258]|nr:hypothetical protein [Rhizobium sp. BE258]
MMFHLTFHHASTTFHQAFHLSPYNPLCGGSTACWWNQPLTSHR